MAKFAALAFFLGLAAAGPIAARQDAGVSATVSVGNSAITVDNSGKLLVAAGVRTSCSATACDSTTPFTQPFEHFNKQCTTKVTMDGTFLNTDQRDYMSGLLQAAMGQTDANSRLDLTGSSEDNDLVLDTGSFGSVVLRDENDDIQAEMTYTVEVDCLTTSSANCGALELAIVPALLSAVPGVGSVLGSIFKTIVCGVPTS